MQYPVINDAMDYPVINDLSPRARIIIRTHDGGEEEHFCHPDAIDRVRDVIRASQEEER